MAERLGDLLHDPGAPLPPLPGHSSRGRLERVLREGRFAVTAELNPPDSADPEEVYETLDPIDTVVIGDVDTCRRKLRRIAEQGLDRLMCLMQFGPLPHEAAMRSIRLAGEQLVPELHAEPQRRRAVG